MVLKGEKQMDPYKYFAIIDKQKNKLIKLVMEPKKPDVSYLDNFLEVIEITESTYCDLAYGDGW